MQFIIPLIVLIQNLFIIPVLLVLYIYYRTNGPFTIKSFITLFYLILLQWTKFSMLIL